jgi:ABC-2 type transport system ATP-binding protein
VRGRAAPGIESLIERQSLIAVEQLTKDYGAVRAVEDVSFTIARGEVAALLGPNGSGKSTVMRVLTGYLSPTAGRVLIDGVDVAERPVAARRQVGYLPEQVTLYPELTVRRYLRFVAEVKGLARRAARQAVDSVIERCGLGEVRERFTGALSKGYRQRVGLAQALVGDPELLVLDEPLVGLDPVQAIEMRALLRALAGRTVILSTHILSEAAALCSRVIVLARGRLVAEDTAAGLASRLDRLGRLTLRVEGPPAAVAAALGAVPGVAEVSPGPADGGPGLSFVLRTAEPEAVQRQVAAVVVGGGWTLLEVRVEAPTLEDLFVRLVSPEAGEG